MFLKIVERRYESEFKFYHFKLFWCQYQLDIRLRSLRNFAGHCIHKIFAKNKEGFNCEILSQFLITAYMFVESS